MRFISIVVASCRSSILKADQPSTSGIVYKLSVLQLQNIWIRSTQGYYVNSAAGNIPSHVFGGCKDQLLLGTCLGVEVWVRG